MRNRVIIFFSVLLVAYWFFRKYAISIDLGVKDHEDLTRSNNAPVLPVITITEKKTGEVVATTQKGNTQSSGKPNGAVNGGTSSPGTTGTGSKKVKFRIINRTSREKAVTLQMYTGYRPNNGNAIFISPNGSKTYDTAITGKYIITVMDVVYPGQSNNPLIKNRSDAQYKNTIKYNHIIDGTNDFIIHI